MKKNTKRYLAMLLAMTLVLQQGGTITLADENEPASEVVTEKTTEVQTAETKAPETKAPETKQEETKAEPQTQPKPEVPKTEENKTPETKPEETDAPDTQTETQKDETATEPENGTEKAIEQVTESEAVTEGTTTEGETQTTPEQEKESEKDSEPETEQKEEAKLDVSVMQEAFQKTVDGATVPMVRYTVKLANKAEAADAEDATLKVLLADALSYKKEEGETPELISFETLGKAIEATALEGEELNEEQKSAYANSNVVLWKDQTIAAGAEKTFVFCAEVKDGQTDVNALKNLWLVNGDTIADKKLQWKNTELLEAEEELPTEFTYEDDGMVVTATLAEGTVLPEGAQFVVEKVELSENEMAQVEAAAGEAKELANYVAYDMHFEVDGEEVEPQGEVAVKIAYKQANSTDFGGETMNNDAAEIQVIHLDEQAGAENVATGAEVGTDGAVSSAEFATDSFSVFVLSQLVDVDRSFLYEDDDVKITAVVGEDEEALNSNLAELKLEVIEDRESKEYKELEKAIEKKEKDNEVLLGLRAYKLTFLKDGEEVEPTGEIKVNIEHKTSSIPEYVPENYISKTTFYQAASGKNAKALDAELKNGRNNSVKEAAMTVSQTTLIEALSHEGVPQNRNAVLGRLGFAQNFAVFAIDFHNNNHMEGSIAVQNLNGSDSQIGNTDAVSQHNHSKTILEIKKVAFGPKSEFATYKFGIFTKENEGKYQLATGLENGGIVEVKTDIEGVGSTTVENLPDGTYYVFELDDSNKPILTHGAEATVNGQSVTVEYSGETTDNSVIAGSVGNKSYVEYFKKPGCTVELFNNTSGGKSAVVIGSTNKIEASDNQSCKLVVGSDGSEYLINIEKTVIEKAGTTFPIDFKAEMEKLSSLSADLAGAVSNSELKVVYLPTKTDGSIDIEKVCVDGEYPFAHDANAWNNTGLTTDGKLLVLNVDCSNATGSVELQGMKVDGQDPQNWSDIANSVIWNFYTGKPDNASAYTGKITYKGGLGTLLAPKATVSCTSSTNGSVIGNKVDHPSCEIHHIKLIETATTTTKRLDCINSAEDQGEAKVSFGGTKSIEGIKQTAKVFTFDLYETGADYVVAEGAKPLQTKTRSGAGSYDFRTIYYTGEGTHYYVVKERALDAPEGFTIDNTEYHIQVTVASDAEGKLAATSVVSGKTGTSPTTETLDFKNTYRAASASTTFSGTKRIEGVDSTKATFSFELYKSDNSFTVTGEPLETVTTKGEITEARGYAYNFKTLTFDEPDICYYVVKEKTLSEKNGFTIDETEYHICVTVTDNGKGNLMTSTTVTTKDGKKATVGTLDFTNTAATTKFSLDVSKKMAESTEKLGTYEFEVQDKDGKTLKTVKNDAKGKVEFSNIATYTLSDIGENFTYVVKEKIPTAPDGTIYDGTVYTVTVSVTADVETGGPKATVTKIEKGSMTASAIEFTNDETHLSILKVDENDKPLVGARLVINGTDGKPVKDADGNVLSWTTDGKAHDITGLPQGGYVLSELEAPDGYDVAPDKEFTITDGNDSEHPVVVEMTDKKTTPTSRSLRVTKELSAKDISPEAHIIVRAATYYVALFEDEERTKRVSDVKKIVFANQESSYATFKNLEADKTYYVGETDEYGTVIPSGRLSENLFYYPEYDGEATFKFEGETTEGLAGFTNVYVEWPDYLYLSGQLTVTKKVMLNGEPATSTDTFYARVFSDAGLTQPVSEILTLSMAGGSETSVLVTNLPIGNRPEDSRKYYVAETDANGTPLDPSAVTEYTVSVDKSEVTLSGSHASDTVVITNDFTEKESEFESEEIESESETEVAKQTAPKTGDDTDFMKYLLLMALSAGLGGIAVGQKRRKARRTRK